MTLVPTLPLGTIAQEVAAKYPLRDTIPLPIERTIEVHQRDFIKKVLPSHMVGMMNQRRIGLTSKRVLWASQVRPALEIACRGEGIHFRLSCIDEVSEHVCVHLCVPVDGFPTAPKVLHMYTLNVSPRFLLPL